MKPDPELAGDALGQFGGALIIGKLGSVPTHGLTPAGHEMLQFMRPEGIAHQGQGKMNFRPAAFFGNVEASNVFISFHGGAGGGLALIDDGDCLSILPNTNSQPPPAPQTDPHRT